jgi:integrase
MNTIIRIPPGPGRQCHGIHPEPGFNAILFLYRNVLKIELTTPVYALRAKRSQHLPTALSKNEVNEVLGGMQGLHQLMAHLFSGCGLRLMECLRLRVKATSKALVHPLILDRRIG